MSFNFIFIYSIIALSLMYPDTYPWISHGYCILSVEFTDSIRIRIRGTLALIARIMRLSIEDVSILFRGDKYCAM
jgi:hypothetical protein